jgi:CheY-like chemotaxis protein
LCDPARILLVEDSPTQAELLRTLLEWEGDLRVTHVQDGLRGAELSRERLWDLIISDLNLPGARGAYVIRASRESHPDTPVLAITGEADDQVVKEALRSGADDILQKPLDGHTLLNRVTLLIGRGTGECASRQQTVLAIGAHPSDVELGCGGILMRHRDRGDRIVILNLLRGSGSDTSAVPRVSYASARRLGAELVLGDPSWDLVPEDVEVFIGRVIRELEPDIVYTHSASDTDRDQRIAFRGAMIAAREVRELYSYQARASAIRFHPRLFVDVTDYLEEKVAMLCGKAQVAVNGRRVDEDLVRSTARYWGRFSRFSDVEPLEPARWLSRDPSPKVS